MIACTIVARNYLAHAQVLAESFRRHHPGSRFVVLVIDGDQAPFDQNQLDVLTPSSVMDTNVFGQMATCYSVVELATAVKPFLLAHLLTLTDAAVYLDPDIEVFAPLDDIAAAAVEHGIVLTPHTVDPMPRDGLVPTEYGLLKAGVFNLGFVAVGHAGGDFLTWWQERLRTDCIVAPDAGLFVDQKWVDYVPCYWKPHVLRDRGCNAAYWNLHERPIATTVDGYTAGGDPLRFFHFSGYDPRRPDQVSKHAAERPRVTMSSPMDELFAAYGRALLDNGYEHYIALPNALATAADGVELTASDRSLYRRGVIAADSGGGDRPPNALSDPESFRRWARTARRSGVDIPRGREVFSLTRELPEDLLRIAMGVHSSKRLRPIAVATLRGAARVVRPFRR